MGGLCELGAVACSRHKKNIPELIREKMRHSGERLCATLRTSLPREKKTTKTYMKIVVLTLFISFLLFFLAPAVSLTIFGAGLTILKMFQGCFDVKCLRRSNPFFSKCKEFVKPIFSTNVGKRANFHKIPCFTRYAKRFVQLN